MPKQVTTRVHARRAASKEALKQMHLILDKQKKIELSSDDDDVIEVGVQPPKKKYKVSHRKSSDDRDLIVLKTVTNAKLDSYFDLEVEVEELSASQLNKKTQYEKEEKEIESKIEEIRKTANCDIVYKGVYTTAVEVTENIGGVIKQIAASAQVPSQSIVLPTTSGNAIPQGYQLVMDPRLGVIVGAVTPTSAIGAPPLQLISAKTSNQSVVSNAGKGEPMKTRRSTGTMKQVGNPVSKQNTLTIKNPASTTTTTSTIPKGTIQVKPSLGKAMQTVKKIAPSQISATIPIAPAKVRVPIVSSFAMRPGEGTSIGGIAVDKSSSDTVTNDGRPAADTVEVSFNKLQGRTYPSLVVVARPQLRAKDITADRSKLDARVKSVLMYHPAKFTEWLIQQGLLRSEQKCSVHPGKLLKLGMYSDATEFPHSGGYVWISECCPQRFVSVFRGSIFEGSNQPPMSILKLIYHWCCQTFVQNVTQWVKVENLFVKQMYTFLRGVCTVALHTHAHQLGGIGVKVQIGVISLGTTSQDGHQRQVKVEVLGVMETSSKYIRLCAIDPVAEGERNYKKRFSKLLEPIIAWVHPASTLITDLTVDKATLNSMGFNNVIQCSNSDYHMNSNRIIMEYLRRVVPRMFQNTLSLLSRPIIQQFLDELVWREWYGTTVMKCFDSMLVHLSEQTRVDTEVSLIQRLNRATTNPFKSWPISGKEQQPEQPKRYSRNRRTINILNTEKKDDSAARNIKPEPASKKVEAVKKPELKKTESPASKAKPVVNQEMVRPAKSSSPDVPEQMVPLENYYYGTINVVRQEEPKVNLNIKCNFCKLTFATNIALMIHLFTHAHNIVIDSQICRYCLTIVPTKTDLAKHVASSHPDETKFDNGFVCLICESRFTNPFMLGKHMSREHCPSELPYLCGTCGFRDSNHKRTIDHFYEVHANGTTIQCPFCLKTLTVHTSGRNIKQNINYFVQHLQKHQKKQLAKRCGRCNLWFIQKEYIKDHQTKMHASQRGKFGIAPYTAPRNGVMVPKSKLDKCPDDAKIINFSTLQFNITNKSLLCKECNKPLTTNKHFGAFESCQNLNCQFSTCCSNSMQGHAAKCKLSTTKLPEERLPYEMFCICGHSDTDGNSMAEHLAICEKKSAYPSSDAAKSATVTHSMLDVLGLVRTSKEPEKASEQPESELIDASQKPRGRPRKQKLQEMNIPVEEEPERIERVILDIPSDDDEETKNEGSDENKQDDDAKETDDTLEKKAGTDDCKIEIVEETQEKVVKSEEEKEKQNDEDENKSKTTKTKKLELDKDDSKEINNGGKELDESTSIVLEESANDKNDTVSLNEVEKEKKEGTSSVEIDVDSTVEKTTDEELSEKKNEEIDEINESNSLTNDVVSSIFSSDIISNDRSENMETSELIDPDISEIDKFLAESTNNDKLPANIEDFISQTEDQSIATDKCNDIVEAISEMVGDSEKMITDNSDSNEVVSNMEELNKLVLEKCGDVVGDSEITDGIVEDSLAIVNKDVEVNNDICPMDTD